MSACTANRNSAQGPNTKDIEAILGRLERGLPLNRLKSSSGNSGKFERLHYRLRLDTRQLLWSSLEWAGLSSAATTGDSYFEWIDLRNIKEVRLAPTAKWLDSLLSDTATSIAPSRSQHAAAAANSSIKRQLWESAAPEPRGQCFVIYYGTKFNLSTMTLAGRCCEKLFFL